MSFGGLSACNLNAKYPVNVCNRQTGFYHAMNELVSIAIMTYTPSIMLITRECMFVVGQREKNKLLPKNFKILSENLSRIVPAF